MYHADLQGTRKEKYRALLEAEKDTVQWTKLRPSTPFYLFIPQDDDLWEEYESGWEINEIFSKNVLGFQTHRDHFAIAYEKRDIERRVKDMLDDAMADQTLQTKYTIQDNRDWHLSESRTLLRETGNPMQSIVPCSYRPFDTRWCFFGYQFMDYPRKDFLEHCHLKGNVILGVGRFGNAVPERPWELVTISNTPIDANIFRRGGVNAFPLYLYPFSGKDPVENLSGKFRAHIDERYEHAYGPEEVLGYVYAVLHTPTFRAKYQDFLKIDFPRIPLVDKRRTFERLAILGKSLIDAHLLTSVPQTLKVDITAGESTVENPTYDAQRKKLYINQTRYFSPVPQDVWEFHVGGYQVLNQYLKARKGRTLSLDEIENVQNTVNVLHFTIAQMRRIDKYWNPHKQ